MDYCCLFQHAEGRSRTPDEEASFKWAYVALMSDHTLRQYENESMGTELACLKLGYLVQAAVLDTPIEDYEHAFFVKPESPTGARAPPL